MIKKKAFSAYTNPSAHRIGVFDQQIIDTIASSVKWIAHNRAAYRLSSMYAMHTVFRRFTTEPFSLNHPRLPFQSSLPRSVSDDLFTVDTVAVSSAVCRECKRVTGYLCPIHPSTTFQNGTRSITISPVSSFLILLTDYVSVFKVTFLNLLTLIGLKNTHSRCRSPSSGTATSPVGVIFVGLRPAGLFGIIIC